LSSNPESDKLSMASRPSLPREMIRRPFIGPHPPTAAGPKRNPAWPFDPHNQVGSAHSPRLDERILSSHEVITDSKLPTLHDLITPKRAQGIPTGEMLPRHTSLGRCNERDKSGGPCSGPEGCDTCKTLRVTSDYVGTSLPPGFTVKLEPDGGRLGAAPLDEIARSVESPNSGPSDNQRKVDDVEVNDHQVKGTKLGSDKPPHSGRQIIAIVSRSAESLKDQEGDCNRKNKAILTVSPDKNSV